jgi:hypothetical protein
MRSPSSRVLINRIDIYVGVPGLDAVRAPQWTYPDLPTLRDIPCTVQSLGPMEVVDDQNRITQTSAYMVMFASDPGVKPRDKIIWRDNTRTLRTLFVQSSFDEAGRGAAFTIRAIEKQ